MRSGSPILTRITLRDERIQPGVHPFDILLLRDGLDLQLTTPVTCLVGENGSGKSTLLEAIAWSLGYGAEGGSREAALAPQRQLAFMRVLHRLTASRVAQFIIATHSPILLTFPGAAVLRLDDGGIQEVDHRETAHFRRTRDFLRATDRYFRWLFEDADEDADAI